MTAQTWLSPIDAKAAVEINVIPVLQRYGLREPIGSAELTRVMSLCDRAAEGMLTVFRQYAGVMDVVGLGPIFGLRVADVARLWADIGLQVALSAASGLSPLGALFTSVESTPASVGTVPLGGPWPALDREKVKGWITEFGQLRDDAFEVNMATTMTITGGGGTVKGKPAAVAANPDDARFVVLLQEFPALLLFLAAERCATIAELEASVTLLGSPLLHAERTSTAFSLSNPSGADAVPTPTTMSDLLISFDALVTDMLSELSYMDMRTVDEALTSPSTAQLLSAKRDMLAQLFQAAVQNDSKTPQAKSRLMLSSHSFGRLLKDMKVIDDGSTTVSHGCPAGDMNAIDLTPAVSSSIFYVTLRPAIGRPLFMNFEDFCKAIVLVALLKIPAPYLKAAARVQRFFALFVDGFRLKVAKDRRSSAISGLSGEMSLTPENTGLSPPI
jgi:hypothetical protein